LVKIFGNLIDNALEAVEVVPPEVRLVKVNLSRIESNFIFEVFNRIPVIPVDLLEKIFESGFSTKKDHTGIGLAAVKNLVHKYGGQVLVTSSESEGTRLKVLIPCG
jgi:sensor histidine kinase regulating citrate/malate metabolism